MAGNENAHDAIDNLLVANTLQEILRNPRGGSFEDLLYKIQTKAGEDRYIHRGVPGYPTKERRSTEGNVLRTMIEMNPAFADTVSLEEGKSRLADYPSILQKLKSYFTGK